MVKRINTITFEQSAICTYTQFANKTLPALAVVAIIQYSLFNIHLNLLQNWFCN